MTSAHVHFKHEGAIYDCIVSIHVGSLPVFTGESQDRAIYAAFDGALAKARNQMRKRKEAEREDKAVRKDKTAFLDGT